MKNQNRRRKTGKIGRLDWLRKAHLEALEDRRLLHGHVDDHEHAHIFDELTDVVIGVGNLPRRDKQIQAEIVINEVEQEQAQNDDPITNDDLLTAQRIPLGFDLGEFQAIDIRGALSDVSVTAVPNKELAPINQNNPLPPEDRDDSSFGNANVASSNGISRFEGFIGDSPFGNNSGNPLAVGGDGDYYRLANIEAGQFVTANVSDTAGATALVLFDEFGRVLQSSESNPAVSNFISHQVHDDGTYYFGVFPFFDVSIFELPDDPTNPDMVYGGPSDNYEITLSVDGAADIDFYAIDLMPGDILGVNGIGSADVLSLRSPDGELMLQSGEDRSSLYPLVNPLPGGGNSSLAYVISEPGTYFLGVQGNRTYNRYLLETRVFRPAIESEPVGSEQILFLDFDGAVFNTQVLAGGLVGINKSTLSPLRDYVPQFGLTNERELIDKVVAEVKADFDDLKAFNPDMKFTVLNSKDHVDPFGQPNVSRVIIGGSQAELAVTGIFGIAESIDVGNFDTSETGVVLLDTLSGSELDPNSVNHYPIAPGAQKVDLVARAISRIVSHEAAHHFGAWHTENLSVDPNIIDSGGTFTTSIGIGPDLVWGTADDFDPKFVDDVWALREGYVGFENVPGMFANVFVAAKGTEGEITPTVSGAVFRDENGDGIQNAGETGFGGIRVYADINGDGEFGISEPTAITAADGSYSLEFTEIEEDVEIRVATGAGQTVTSPASGMVTVGEIINGTSPDFGVESLTGDASGTDFGHAPLSYGAASHDIQSGIRLGQTVTGDDASGEDISDDGVGLSGLVIGGTGTATVTALAEGFSPALVNGWIDFNDNGRFEASERVVSNVRLSGTEALTFPIPASAIAGETWARFRLGYVRDVAPNGASGVGEVEDYVVTIASPGGGTGGGGGGGNVGPQANPDIVSVDAGAADVVLNVLANDSAGSEAVTIQQVSGSSVGSIIQVSTDGQRIVYTPAAGLTDSETFSYTIGNSVDTSTTTVTVNINAPVDPGGDLVAIRLEAKSTDGSPITTIAAGQSFFVDVLLNDLRSEADRQGVFAAYLDVVFDTDLADFNGDIQFGDYFVNQQNPVDGDLANLPGPEDDDIGAFGGFDPPTEVSNQLLMTIPMVAKAAGVLDITTNGPDNARFREILLFPSGSPNVTDERVDFGSLSLTITDGAAAPASAFTNLVNRFDVDGDGFVVPRDALHLVSNINRFGARQLDQLVAPVAGPYLDVSGDGWLTAADALQLVRELNRLAALAAAGEPDDVSIAAAVDAAMSEDDEELFV